MGVTPEAAINTAVSNGWTSDPTTGTMTPKLPEPTQKEIPLTSEQELALLTDYVSFLENWFHETVVEEPWGNILVS